MTILTRTGLRAALVALVISSWWTSASAQSSLTPAGTSIQNRATVNYSVGGQPQTVIESSPTGNTTPGVNAGASTTFVVDNRVDLTVAELSGSATITAPGATNAALAFTVTNTGNAPQGYRADVDRGSRDRAVRQHGQRQLRQPGRCASTKTRAPARARATTRYDGTETATAIEVLNPGYSVTVFVVSPTVPLTLVNANFANVNLQAQTAVINTNGATLVAASAGATTRRRSRSYSPTPATTPTQAATDQFAIQSAALTVTKAQTVLDDGFGSASPRAIPNAVVEYTITVANSSTTTAASGHRDQRSDPGHHDVPDGALCRLERRRDHGRRERRPASRKRRPTRTRTAASATPAATSSSAARRSAASLPAPRRRCGSASGSIDRDLAQMGAAAAARPRVLRGTAPPRTVITPPRQGGAAQSCSARAVCSRPFFVGALLALLLAATAAAAPPGTSISNRAEVQFIGSAGPTTIVSNSVDVVVVPAPSRAALTLLRADTRGSMKVAQPTECLRNGEPLTLPPPLGSNGQAVCARPTAGARHSDDGAWR